MTCRDLLCDVDGIVSDFCAGVDREVRSLGGTPGNWANWDLESNIPSDLFERVLRAIKSPGWCHFLPEIPGAVDDVRAAMAGGVSIVFVTATMSGSRTWSSDRAQWLRDRFGAATRVIHVERGADKRLIDGCALIEDNVDNIREWVTARPGLAYRVERPYNRGSSWGVPVSSVGEAIGRIIKAGAL